MKIFTMALMLTAAALIVGLGWMYVRPINWSAASSAMAESHQQNATITGKRSAVIVELFTSEGCSSCPPADKVLAELEKTQPVADAEIIVLSEHVDYWNYIGWSDPFSSALFSARQQAYAPVFRNDGVYTPQMVVDGQAEFIGSNLTKAQTAIARAAKLPKGEVSVQSALDAQSVKLKISVAKLPAIVANDTAELLLAITENNLTSQVARGENSGRRLPHTAVVRELRSLGNLNGSSKPFQTETTLLIGKNWKRENLRAVAFVQERRNKRILGAASTNLTRE
ncbi:MAG: DUF1223 domain-containing protein [Blastocatellia bacterium]